MYRFSPQAQEELDYFPQSELQNAFALSRMERPRDDSQKIADLVSAGRFVVVISHPVYCPRTDASMGSFLSLDSHFDDEAAAQARIEELGDMDESFAVIDQLSVPRNPQLVSAQSDEIPF
jgi:hypothetical protein